MTSIVTTNVAGILTIIVIWGTIGFILTYMYMSTKVKKLEETIDFLDDYIREAEKEYGHVIDEYIDHYYSDGEWTRS